MALLLKEIIGDPVYTQKYETGDLVKIVKNLGPSMAHFTNDKEAIILGSYSDIYGGSSASANQTYSVFIKDRGKSSWYYENQLTLIDKNRIDLLRKWRIEKENENAAP